MSYTITITQTKEVKEVRRKDYAVLGQQYITKEQYDALDHKKKEDYEILSNGQYKKSLYGYPSPEEVTAVKDIKVYEQTVESLDINAVIKAVNFDPSVPKAISK